MKGWDAFPRKKDRVTRKLGDQRDRRDVCPGMLTSYCKYNTRLQHISNDVWVAETFQNLTIAIEIYSQNYAKVLHKISYSFYSKTMDILPRLCTNHGLEIDTYTFMLKNQSNNCYQAVVENYIS